MAKSARKWSCILAWLRTMRRKKIRANAEALLPELEAKSKLEKKYAIGQLPLIIPESSEYEKEISLDERVRPASLVNEEHVTEGPFEIWGHVYNRLGLEYIFGCGVHDIGSTNLLRLCLTAKLSEGGSKRSAAAWVKNTLGLKFSEDRIYKMMDKFYPKIPQIKDMVLSISSNLFGESLSPVLYDVTTLYFESFTEDEVEETKQGKGGNVEKEDTKKGDTDLLLADGREKHEKTEEVREGLRRKGYSKDNKFKETQVVLALCPPQGTPLWYEVFPGNRAESTTFNCALEEMQGRLLSKDLWVVADSAMLNNNNLESLKKQGYYLPPKGRRDS